MNTDNHQMDVNECHGTLFGQRTYSVYKLSFSFLMSYGGTRQSSGRWVFGKVKDHV